RAEDERVPGEPEPPPVPEGARGLDPRPRDPRQRRPLHARRDREPGRPRPALLRDGPRPHPVRRRTPDPARLLPGRARPDRARTGPRSPRRGPRGPYPPGLAKRYDAASCPRRPWAMHRTRRGHAKGSRGGESHPNGARSFAQSGLLFDARGGRRTGTSSPGAPFLEEPSAREARLARPDRARARARRPVAADLYRPRVQPPDALALAGRPRYRRGRVRAAGSRLAANRGARRRARRGRHSPVLAPLLDRPVPLAGTGQLGR